MLFKHIYIHFYWKVLGVIFMAPVNISAFSPSKLYNLRTQNVAKLLQVNVSPNFHKSYKENLTIFELVTLSQLQNFVANSIGVKQFNDPFWTSTSFLTNLLDSSQWNIQKAKRKIQKAANWRNNNDELVQQLPNKNLFDYFNLEIKGFDKEGCAVVIIPVGQWRTYRSYVEKIKSFPEINQSLKIYFSKIVEMILHQIRKQEDSECSQFLLIADMEHYSTIHTSGVKFFIETIKLFDKVYPGLLKIAYIINSSPTFLSVAETYKSQIPWDLRRKSFLYTEKRFWKDVILQNIDASELAPKYGGTNFFLE